MIAQHPRRRRLDVLHRRLHPHLPRPLLRVLQGAARGALDPRRVHLPRHDGDGLHGLHAALGPDELLGRHRHHQPVLVARTRSSRASAPPSSNGCGAATRSRARRSTASSRCTTCCRSCWPASSSCTSGRCMSSARTTRPASTSRPSRTRCRCTPTRSPRTRSACSPS